VRITPRPLNQRDYAHDLAPIPLCVAADSLPIVGSRSKQRHGFATMVVSLTPRTGDPTGILRLDYGVNWIGELEDKHYGRQIEAYRNPKRNGQNRKTEKQKRKEATRLAALLGGEWGQLVGDIEVC
jgi:hypothetical protein